MTYCMYVYGDVKHSLAHSLDHCWRIAHRLWYEMSGTRRHQRHNANSCATSRRFTVFRVQFSVERLGDGATLGDGRRENGDLTAKHAAAAVDEWVHDELSALDRFGATDNRLRRLGLYQHIRQKNTDLPEPTNRAISHDRCRELAPRNRLPEPIFYKTDLLPHLKTDLPEPAELVQATLGEDERRGAEHSRIDVDDVLTPGGVHQHVHAEQTEEAASVKCRRHRLGRPA